MRERIERVCVVVLALLLVAVCVAIWYLTLIGVIWLFGNLPTIMGLLVVGIITYIFLKSITE